MSKQIIVSPPRAQEALAKAMSKALMSMSLDDIHELFTVTDVKVSSFNHGLFAKHVVSCAKDVGLTFEVTD